MGNGSYRLDVLRASTYFGDQKQDRVAMVGVFPLRGRGSELNEIARWTVGQTSISDPPRWEIRGGVMFLEHEKGQSDVRVNLKEMSSEVEEFLSERGNYGTFPREIRKAVYWYDLASDRIFSSLAGLCIVREVAMNILVGRDRKENIRVRNFEVVEKVSSSVSYDEFQDC